MADAPSSRSDDIAIRVADTVENVVTVVRDKATGPALTAVRAVVFGLLILVMGITAVVLLSVMAVRLLDVALPGEVWSAHLVAGTVFTLAGAICWRLRRPKPVED